jgi:hypothetical protein
MTDDPFPASANENGILLVDLCISDGEGAIPPAARMGIKQGLYFSRISPGFDISLVLFALLGQQGGHGQGQHHHQGNHFFHGYAFLFVFRVLCFHIVSFFRCNSCIYHSWDVIIL